MWLLSTMLPWDRSPKKSGKNSSGLPYGKWGWFVGVLLLKCIGLGFFQLRVKSELYLKHSCFWVINHSETRDTNWEHSCSGCKSRVRAMHGWLKHMRGCCQFPGPNKELWACRGDSEEQKWMLNAWWGSISKCYQWVANHPEGSCVFMWSKTFYCWK